MTSDPVASSSRPGVLGRLGAVARTHPDPVAVTGLALAPFLLLGRALLPDRVLSPADILLLFPPWSSLAPGLRAANPLLSDVTLLFHPWLIWSGSELGHGHFPLWNPHVFAGAPFFANPQSALLFPLTWLAAVLAPATAVTLVAILKLALAGVGMYWFLRLLPLVPLAAAIGALAFMLSGPLVVWVHWSLGTAIATLPFLFAGSEWLRRRPTGARVVVVAFIVALALLSGYLQLSVIALVAAGVWTLVRARDAARPGAFVAGWTAAAGLGVLLSAVQLLPFIEYARESSVYAYRSGWMPVMAVPPRAALTFLLPYYFGTPAGGDFWGYWNFNEIAATVGIVPWVALPAALAGRWRQTTTRALVALAALAAVLCYDTPGLTETLARVPPLSLVVTYRYVVFLAFALAALGAVGIDALLATPPGEARPLRLAVRGGTAILVLATFAIVAGDYPILAATPARISPFLQYLAFLVLAAGAALAALWLGRPATPAAAAALLVAQLASTAPLAATYNPVIDRATFYPAPPPAVRHVQAAEVREPGRVLFAAVKNTGMLYGLHEVTGYDGMTPRRIGQLVSPVVGGGLNLIASGSINPTVDLASPVFDLLGVRRLVVPRGMDALPPHFVLDYDGPDARVWRNPRALPRAFLVSRARCLDDPTALRLMHEGQVDFRAEVLIHDCAPLGSTDAAGGVGRAEVTKDGGERVGVAVESDGPAWLVLADTWFPGWRARVDGVEQPAWRADYAFRAVRVPAGQHVIEWSYRPPA
ncbi:MAG: hypothetical protein HY614_01770, partial [Candidatus Rokubacteria bacterium]|nr:hypothetical protein [Candidatus Rokubacteria bacterium]